MREFLLKQGVPQKLLDEIEAFRKYYKLEDEYIDRIPQPRYKYYGGQATMYSYQGLRLLVRMYWQIT